MKKVVVFVAGVCLVASAAFGASGIEGEPAKANKFQATLVNAYPVCTSPDATTGGALPLPSCNAVDAALCAFGAKGQGQVAAKAKTDVSLAMKIKGLDSCPDGTVLGVTVAFSSATDNCVGHARCKTVDVPSFPLTTCTVAKGACSIKTTINTLIPGAIATGKNTSIAIGSIGVVSGTTAIASAGLLVP